MSFSRRLNEKKYNSFEEATTSVIFICTKPMMDMHIAQARLLISRRLPVLKAITTDVLEDEDEAEARSSMFYVLRIQLMILATLCFLVSDGFEVKTIKPVLGTTWIVGNPNLNLEPANKRWYVFRLLPTRTIPCRKPIFPSATGSWVWTVLFCNPRLRECRM